MDITICQKFDLTYYIDILYGTKSRKISFTLLHASYIMPNEYEIFVGINICY